MFENVKPRSLRFATTLSVIGLQLQGIAFIMPYLIYFEIIKIKNEVLSNLFLISALILNVIGILCLLYFFLIFYNALISLLQNLYIKQNSIDKIEIK